MNPQYGNGQDSQYGQNSQNIQNANDMVQFQDKDDEIEIDLLGLLFFFRARLIFIIVAFVLGAVVAGLYTRFLVTPLFTATAKMYMVSASSGNVVDLTDLNLGTSISSDYEEMIKIRPIFEDVIDDEQLEYTYEQLLGMVTIATLDDTRILTISVKSPDPEEAAKIANALAEKATVELPKLMETPEPHIAEHAIVPKRRSSPSYSKNIMIGALAVTVIVMAVFTFFYVTDDTLKSAEDIEKAFGVMPLTVIPEGDIEEISDKKEKEIAKEKRKRRRSKRESESENNSEK